MNLKLFSILLLSSGIWLGCSNNSQNSEAETTEGQVAEDRKCDFCGMPYADYPNWHVHAQPSSGKNTFYFCSPNCFFSHTFEQSTDYAQGSVTMVDYYKLADIDGKSAFYVSGSDVPGPMGVGLVPFATEADAQAFWDEHNASGIHTFEEVTPAVLKSAMNM